MESTTVAAELATPLIHLDQGVTELEHRPALSSIEDFLHDALTLFWPDALEAVKQVAVQLEAVPVTHFRGDVHHTVL